MRKNKIKQVMQSNQLALGAYVGLADPQIVEIIGIAGFDAAFIDMEHTAFDLSLVQQMIIAAELVGISPIVRVSDSDPHLDPQNSTCNQVQVRQLQYHQFASRLQSASQHPLSVTVFRLPQELASNKNEFL